MQVAHTLRQEGKAISPRLKKDGVFSLNLMKHKKILFDQIKAEKKQERVEARGQSLTYNFSINLLYMIIKLISITIVTLVGSILLSALITAATRNQPFLTTLQEFIQGLIHYFNW